MFRYTTRIGVAVGAALIAAGLTTGALAQDGEGRGTGRGPGHHAGMGLKGLDLTDAQRQQIQDIRQGHRDEMRQAGERLRTAHRAQREAAMATPADEGRIRATSQGLADALTEMAVLRARVHQQVLSVLTPEQQERAKTLRSERGQGFRTKGRMGRDGGRRQWRR